MRSETFSNLLTFLRSGGDCPLSSPENKFPRKIAISEINRHLTSIIALASRTYPNIPITRIGYQIDTTVFPLQISPFSVERIAKCKTTKLGSDSMMLRVVEVAKDALGKADTHSEEYQPTMLKIKQHANSFAYIAPILMTDVKMAEERVARGDVPRALGAELDFVRCEDKAHNSMSLDEGDEIQEIVRLIKLRSRSGKGSVWYSSIIQEVIEDYLARTCLPPSAGCEPVPEEQAMVLYRGGMESR